MNILSGAASLAVDRSAASAGSSLRLILALSSWLSRLFCTRSCVTEQDRSRRYPAEKRRKVDACRGRPRSARESERPSLPGAGQEWRDDAANAQQGAGDQEIVEGCS